VAAVVAVAAEAGKANQKISVKRDFRVKVKVSLFVVILGR